MRSRTATAISAPARSRTASGAGDPLLDDPQALVGLGRGDGARHLRLRAGKDLLGIDTVGRRASRAVVGRGLGGLRGRQPGRRHGHIAPRRARSASSSPRSAARPPPPRRLRPVDPGPRRPCPGKSQCASARAAARSAARRREDVAATIARWAARAVWATARAASRSRDARWRHGIRPAGPSRWSRAAARPGADARCRRPG